MEHREKSDLVRIGSFEASALACFSASCLSVQVSDLLGSKSDGACSS